jgi:hypothetical protein
MAGKFVFAVVAIDAVFIFANTSPDAPPTPLQTAAAAVVAADPADVQPIPVTNDPGVRYAALRITTKPNGTVEILNRRIGSSGITYAFREVNCKTRKARYLGEGDTQEAALRGVKNGYGNLSPGSISWDVSRFACGDRW